MNNEDKLKKYGSVLLFTKVPKMKQEEDLEEEEEDPEINEN